MYTRQTKVPKHHILTDQQPFAAGLVGVQTDRALVVTEHGHVDAAPVVRPRAELEPAALVVEREPADVDGARRDEETERNPQTVSRVRDHHVRRKLAVNVLVRTVPYVTAAVQFIQEKD